MGGLCGLSGGDLAREELVFKESWLMSDSWDCEGLMPLDPGSSGMSSTGGESASLSKLCAGDS